MKMYDDVGNLQTFTDAAGNSTVSKYGPLRELMEVDTPPQQAGEYL